MSCSKKDYVAIARIIQVRIDAARPIPTDTDTLMKMRRAQFTTAEAIGFNLAEYFGAQSPAFDRARFLKACGIGEQS